MRKYNACLNMNNTLSCYQFSRFFGLAFYEFDLIKKVLSLEFEGITLKNQVLLMLIEAIIVFVPGIFLCIKKKISYWKLFHVYAMVACLGIILSFTIFRRSVGSRVGIIHWGLNTGFGFLGPWSSWSAAFSILNIILFIPWGMVICLFFRKQNFVIRIVTTTILGTLTSVAIECLQLFTATGMFEMTDIVTNSVGTFIGAMIISVVLTVIGKKFYDTN